MSYRTGSSTLSRDLNRAAIMRLIGASGPIARVSIAGQLGLSPATVTSITRELLEGGVVRVARRAPSDGGRPAVLLELVGAAATALGVKIAPDHLVGVRVDLDGEALERFEESFDATAPDSADRISQILGGWLADSASDVRLLGVGLGVPGVVDAERGSVTSPLIGWSDYGLRDHLQEALQLPVLVDNDVNTLAISERLYGRGREAENFIAVTLGRGIGLGIVANGDIYHGYGGGAGEFGHTTAVEGGPRCSCGKNGCLEALVADPALVQQGRSARILRKGDGIGKLRALAGKGNVKAIEIYERAGTILGRSVADLVNVLSPQIVLVSGEGTEAWPFLERSFEKSLRTNLFPALSTVAVEVDPWDDAKWALGAAALVLRATFTPLGDGSNDELSMRTWVRAEPPTPEVVA